jgi:hypothetical protein
LHMLGGERVCLVQEQILYQKFPILTKEVEKQNM